MSEPTDRAVNRAAISNMMMPTGILAFRPVRAAIQPLVKQMGDKVSELEYTRRGTEWIQAQYTHHVPQPVIPIVCRT